MDSTPTLFSRAEASPSTADRLLKAQQQARYVKEFWLFLTSIIALLTVINFTSRLLNYLFKPVNPDGIMEGEKSSSEAFAPGRTGKLSFRRLPDALASAFRVVAYRTTVTIGPSSVASVSEVVFIAGYLSALLAWLWVNTRDMDTFFFEDRAAHLASCQLPLIVALAGKNNIISFLVGIGHEKLNVLHRAAARSCLLMLWIHAMLRAAPGLPAVFDLSHGWMRWGVTGLAAFTLATMLSIRPIRQAAFEFFLITHIFLIGVFLVGGYIHAKNPGFGNYIWPALPVWGLDRLLRLSRLLCNNRVWRGTKDTDDNSKATVELLSHDTVRLTLRRRLSWKAGQHAYVILPSISNIPTEAHPFTIASIPDNVDGTKGNNERDVVFLIRSRSGFTKRLREHAMQKAAGPVTAYIDGPYGCPPNLKTFSTCVLIAGGSGVSYALPLLMDLVHHARARTSSVRRILFIWSVRELEHLSWIAKLLATALHSAPSTLQIDSRIHITGLKAQLPDVDTLDYDSSLPSSPSDESDEGKKMEPATAGFRTMRGRPEIRRLLSDVVTSATGPVSVDVAGPSALAQSVRSALASDITSPWAVLKGRPAVTLHVETFGMVKG